MARVSVDKTWLVQDPSEDLDASIDLAIQEYGMIATRAGRKVEMRGGSQLKMRILGAWFTKDSVLPRGGTLERITEPDHSSTERITLHLEDRMGFGLMDSKIRQKYDRLFQSIACRIEAVIRGNTSDTRDAPTPEIT